MPLLLLLPELDAAEDVDEEEDAGEDELLSEELLELPLLLAVDPALDDDEAGLLSVR